MCPVNADLFWKHVWPLALVIAANAVRAGDWLGWLVVGPVGLWVGWQAGSVRPSQEMR